jgi:hypothetical protein
MQDACRSLAAFPHGDFHRGAIHYAAMTHTPTCRCRRAGSSLEPSGDTARAAWRAAEWISEFRLANGGTQLPPDRYLRAALLWDDEALYAAWESAPSLVPVTKTEHDADLWEECTVELFLAAGAGYYEIEVNPRGAVLDLHFPNEEDDDWLKYRSWDAEEMRWAVRPGSLDGLQPWTAELSLPWAAVPALTRETVDGQVCLWAQVCRSQRQPDGTFELPAWGPVQGKFCQRRFMGRVLLVE